MNALSNASGNSPTTISALPSGVPSIAVDGRYLINNEAVSSYEELLKLTDSVVAKVRQERKGK